MMNRNALTHAIAALAVAGTVLANPVHAQRDGVKIEGLEKIARIDLRDMALTRYRANGKSGLSEDQAYRVAEELVGATGGDVDPTKAELREDVLRFVGREDLSAGLDVDTRFGDISYSGGLARYSADGTTPGLPDAKEAPELALQWVSSIGLLPPADEMVVAHVGGLNMSARDEDGRTADYAKLVTVRFERELGGLPVLGASRLVVHLGEQGQLQGLVLSWVQVEREEVDPAAVLDPEATLGEALELFEMTSGDARSIRVEDAEVVLYDDGAGTIEPAIHVTAMRSYADKRLGEQPLDFYVPALLKTRGDFPSMRSENVPDR